MGVSHAHITATILASDKFFICDDGHLYSLDSHNNRDTGVIFRVMDLVRPEGDYIESKMLRLKNDYEIILMPYNKEILFYHLLKDLENV